MYFGWGPIAWSKPPQKSGWFYIQVEEDLANYYKKLHNIQCYSPRNGPHITFIAGEKDVKIIDPTNPILEPWLYCPIPFAYDGTVCSDGRSWWIPCTSQPLNVLREKLGLGVKKFGYHITLGNIK